MRNYIPLITGNWDGCDCMFFHSWMAAENLNFIYLIVLFICVFSKWKELFNI